MAGPGFKVNVVCPISQTASGNFLTRIHTMTRQNQVTVRSGMESGHLPYDSHHFFHFCVGGE
jgi:hypothetical protein